MNSMMSQLEAITINPSQKGEDMSMSLRMRVERIEVLCYLTSTGKDDFRFRNTKNKQFVKMPSKRVANLVWDRYWTDQAHYNHQEEDAMWEEQAQRVDYSEWQGYSIMWGEPNELSIEEAEMAGSPHIFSKESENDLVGKIKDQDEHLTQLLEGACPDDVWYAAMKKYESLNDRAFEQMQYPYATGHITQNEDWKKEGEQYNLINNLFNAHTEEEYEANKHRVYPKMGWYNHKERKVRNLRRILTLMVNKMDRAKNWDELIAARDWAFKQEQPTPVTVQGMRMHVRIKDDKRVYFLVNDKNELWRAEGTAYKKLEGWKKGHKDSNKEHTVSMIPMSAMGSKPIGTLWFDLPPMKLQGEEPMPARIRLDGKQLITAAFAIHLYREHDALEYIKDNSMRFKVAYRCVTAWHDKKTKKVKVAYDSYPTVNKFAPPIEELGLLCKVVDAIQ